MSSVDDNKVSILVLDDEECIRFTFEVFLAEEGYAVSKASSFDEAVDMIKNKRIDIVFADMILGGKTGLDFAHEIRRLGIGCRIVIMTGDPTADVLTSGEGLNISEYLAKPVVKEKLLETVKKLLRTTSG